MKPAMVLSSILAILAISFTLAQNEIDPKPPNSLLSLFHLGDHLGYSRNADLSGYLLTLYTEQDSQKVKEFVKKRRELTEQIDALRPSSGDSELRKKNLEAERELRKRISEVSRPIPFPIGKVFAIGTDYIGLVGLESGAELYIPISGIASVSRKLGTPMEGVQK